MAWAREIEDRGAGEILITSIERDGAFQGYDLALIAALVHTMKISVIASGDAGNYQHMVEAVKQAGASAVAAASMFHFTEQTPAGAKAAMQDAGIPVRRNFIDNEKNEHRSPHRRFPENWHRPHHALPDVGRRRI